jgi:hypothetical protein
MKKKLYMKPEAKVYCLNMRPALLAGSMKDQLQDTEIDSDEII